MVKVNTVSSVEHITFEGKSIESIATEYQRMLEKLQQGGYNLRMVLSIENRGLLLHAEKSEVAGVGDVLQAILSGNLPPGFQPPSGGGDTREDEYTPSDEFLQFIAPFAEAWRAMPPSLSLEQKLLPPLFDRFTAQLPVMKMRAFAEELPRMIEHHKKQCACVPIDACTFGPFFEEVQKRLIKKAQLNTQ